jgi:hypothetical protein
MEIENKIPQQDLDVDEILSSGKDFQITPENVNGFYKGMQNAIKRTSCRVCGLDNLGVVNVVGNDGNLIEKVVVLGGKRCEAKVVVLDNEEGNESIEPKRIETTIVTVFKYIGPSREEIVTRQEIDMPIWACREFVRKTYPILIKKPKLDNIDSL